MSDDEREKPPEELRVEKPEGELEPGARWLRSYLEELEQERLVVCLSGGIDSATTAMWAARAVGPDRLILLSLPYGVEDGDTARRGDDAGSVELASAVVGRIREDRGEPDYRVLDIAPTVDREAADSGLQDAIEGADEEHARVWHGNLKARIRGVRARTVANVENALVLGTENRTEFLLGYFTVDGDEQSDLGLLRAYLKTEVRQLAEALGVPEEIRTRPPTAGLWRGQRDEEELGFSYGEADRVLQHLFDRTRAGSSRTSPEQELTITGLPGVDPEVARRVLRQVQATAHKRRSTPFFQRGRSSSRADDRGEAPPRGKPRRYSLETSLSESQRRRLDHLRKRRDREDDDDDRKYRR